MSVASSLSFVESTGLPRKAPPAPLATETYCFIAPHVRLGHYQLGTLERVLPAEDDRLFDEIVDVELTRCDAL